MAGRPVGRTESCPECDADIRSCRGCAHFVPSQSTCNEPTAEPPADRERANFCSAYRLASYDDASSARTPAAASPSAGLSSADAARARLEALFKK